MSDSRGFESFLATRERLSACLVEIGDALGGLAGGGERAKQLEDARKSLLQDAFRLMIVGEFKRGKSTLVNSLLGRDVLPARVAPCTAIITEVRYADDPHAVLRYNDPAKPPDVVGVDDLKKYVVIEDDDDSDDDPLGQIRESPYASMELYYPLELCKNNVQIVDSPGLNEHKTRTKVALDFLSKADALVMVLSCQQALSQSEMRFIDNQLGGRNLRHVFFLWNHYDAIIDSDDDIADIQRRSKKYLEPRVGSNARIFYVSARTALVGKKKGDQAAIERSGILPFEAALERFLAVERGRVKLLTPLRMAEAAVREAVTEIIPRSESMLSQPLEKLLTAYEEQRPRLEDAERQRERILRSIERRRDALIREASASYQRFVGDVERDIQEEVKKIDVGMWEALASRKKVNEKLAEELQGWLEKRTREWQDEDFAHIFEAHTKELEADLEKQAQAFFATMDDVRRGLIPSASIEANETDVGAVDRLLSTVGGFFIGGIGSAIEGASLGFKGMLPGLALNIVVSAGLLVAGFGLPVVLPALAVVGIVRTVTGAQSTIDKIRNKVAAELVGKMREAMPDTIAKITEQITGGFAKLQSALDSSLRIQIDEVAGQVQAILKEKQAGEARMKAERERLAAARTSLVALSKRLEAIRNEADAPTEA